MAGSMTAGDTGPDEERPAKAHLSPGTLVAPEDAVPTSPWTFRRVNEHGHVHVEAAPGTVAFDEPMPIAGQARIHLGRGGTVVGVAVTYPNGRVVGTINDATVGARLIRHVNFLGITATWNTITIDDTELGK
jgi:hypothetical protein